MSGIDKSQDGDDLSIHIKEKITISKKLISDNNNDSDNEGKSEIKKSITPQKGNKKPVNIGIDSFQINAARELFQLTTSSRIPTQFRGTPSIKPQQQQQQSQAQLQSRTQSQKVDTRTNVINKDLKIKKQVDEQLQTRIPNIQVPAKSHKGKCKNPQCEHCGIVIIPSPSASYPISETPSISINNWEIYSNRNPILSSSEIEILEDELEFPVPEMIFGNNKIEVVYKVEDENTGDGAGGDVITEEEKFRIVFNASDALRQVENHETIDPKKLLKVSYANEWLSTRKEKHQNTEDVVLDIYKPFDWTYSSEYKGTVKTGKFIRDDSKEIPLNKLRDTNEPILFFDDMVLYEDELADNGISSLSVKVRVMKNCLLILQKLFIRVDNVLLRVFDTRVYIDFEELVIIREFKKMEINYDDILKIVKREQGSSADPRSFLRDINWCSSKMPVISLEREYMELS
ncbi:hypothetical protein BVG19_g4865 [[Candida] boidinii]|nr:hypothetical protein BVG19_g4865 [[Candida] boidinii]OWB51245.1 hypothetical protein B5S27_g2804 [[Candida] boidinii]